MRDTHNPGEDDVEEIDLTSLERDFASAPPATSSIPDGRYHVRIENAELMTARFSHRPILKWRLRILGPAFRDRLLWKTSLLGSTDSLRWLKHDLQLCGVALEKLADLPLQLERLLDVELAITTRTRGDWQNVHFNRRLSSALRPPSSDHNGGHENVPF
jgi:hypothetical protein